MISHIVIVVSIALNLLPPDVHAFIITTPEKETTRYARHPRGGYGVTPATADDAKFFIKGTTLTIKTHGQDVSMDLAQILGIRKDTDWKTINCITFGDKSIRIQRQANGANITIGPSKQQAAKEAVRLYQVRWEKET